MNVRYDGDTIRVAPPRLHFLTGKRLERMIRERWKSAGVVKTGRSGRRSDDGGTTEGCLVNSIFMPRGVPTGTWEFCHKFAFDAIQGMIFRREQRGIIRE